MATDVDYYIEAGVRRAVAARELGLKFIAAELHCEGQPAQRLNVPVERLHSPKTEIEADGRYVRVRQALSTVQGRNQIANHARILLQILGADPCQPPAVPLKDVKLLPVKNP